MASPTSNTVLTLDKITSEALRILHQNLNFIGNINREYDDSFARKGAKIGDTLRIRLPNQYTVTSGASLSSPIQDVVEEKTTLTVNNQHHVDMQFSSADLTLKLDDFSERFIKPAMSVLAAKIEALTLAAVLPAVNNVYNGSGSAFSLQKALAVRKILTDNLAPSSDRYFVMNTQDNVDIVNDVKALFNDTSTISKQYREGMTGRTAGFDFFENTLLQSFTTGSSTTATVASAVTTNGATSLTTSAAVTLKKGDVFTVAGCFKVHPESKDVTNVLQQFVVTSDVTAGTTVGFYPAIYVSGGKQNIQTSIPAATLTKVGTSSQVFNQSVAFHKDAFTFATADLELPGGTDMAARKTFDGISLRLVRDYDINYDTFPCRLDVLWGAAAIRPSQAVRVYNN